MRANGVTMRANGVTMRADGVTMRADGVTMRADGVTMRAIVADNESESENENENESEIESEYAHTKKVFTLRVCDKVALTAQGVAVRPVGVAACHGATACPAVRPLQHPMNWRRAWRCGLSA